MHTKQTITCLTDLPAAPCTIDTMAWNQTGTWRYLTPSPLDRRPPCSHRGRSSSGRGEKTLQPATTAVAPRTSVVASATANQASR